MTFKKVTGTWYNERLQREDGKYTIDKECICVKVGTIRKPSTWKDFFIVKDENGVELERFTKQKDAKEKYSN
jgi:hypothetical protein